MLRLPHISTLAATAVAITALTPAAAHASTPSATTTHGRVTAAIIGGTTASSAALPSLAFIDGQFDDGSGESCSGTVVAPRLVLTAGHCAEDLTTGVPYAAADLHVTTGTANVSGDGGQTIAVSRTIIDPAFDTADQDHDAALLVLAHATTAPAITLATSAPVAGTTGTIAGWGETSGTALDPPTVLRQASTDVLDPTACATAWGDLFDPTAELCTLDPDQTAGACRGDSGGPLLADENGVTVELGLAIFVAEGCATDDPDVYTRADVIAPWVQSEIAALPVTTTAVATTAVASPAARPSAHHRRAITYRRSLLRAVTAAAEAGRQELDRSLVHHNG